MNLHLLLIASAKLGLLHCIKSLAHLYSLQYGTTVINLFEGDLESSLRTAKMPKLLVLKGIDSTARSYLVTLRVDQAHVLLVVEPVHSFDGIVVVNAIDVYVGRISSIHMRRG